MKFRVERELETDHDLEAIFSFLSQSYVEFGHDRRESRARAAKRMEAIKRAMLSLGAMPHQGTLRTDLLPGLRSVTKERAVLYFTVDEEEKVVRIQAIFFGGQDHQRAMLKRLSGG